MTGINLNKEFTVGLIFGLAVSTGFFGKWHIGDKPFFTSIHTNAPHDPYIVPDSYSAPYREAGLSETLAIGEWQRTLRHAGRPRPAARRG